MGWLHQTACAFPTMLAQRMAESRDWIDRIADIDAGKLAVILIFGTGFVSVLIYGAASLVRAYHGAPDEAEDLDQRLGELEKRVAALEKDRSTPV